MGVKKYRHNKITAPTPNSKSFVRKEAKRKRAAIEAGEQYVPTVPSAVSSTPKKARNELKSAHQIMKERKEKEKRREKTGRHHLAKNKKKRS
jgi:ATP-dependent RNA helicase DDX54/DBP10